MITILPIVEGHGEVSAVPLLVRRIALEFEPPLPVTVAKPIRLGKDSLLQNEGVERAVELAARQTSPQDGILILLDADDGCPKGVAEELRSRARTRRPDRRISVVLASREFEAWFAAAARSLGGRRGFREDLVPPENPEAIRDVKGWLTRQLPAGRSYKPTIDQAALVQIFDLQDAMAARSFRKLVKEVRALLAS